MTLHDAIRCGDGETIRDLIDAGVPVAARDDERRTTLLIAAEAENLAAVRVLVEAGAEVDTPALPPREDPNDPPAPILPVVCRRGVIDRIRPLQYGQVTVRQRRKGNPDGPTRLMIAAAAGHEAIFACLLEAGAQGNERDRDRFTALAYAAAFGHEGIVGALIEAGAAVDREDDYGNRPPWYELDVGQPEIADLLVEAGAGSDFVSAAYLKARTSARWARAPGFQAQVDALAGRCGVRPGPWTDSPTRRDFRRIRQRGEIPTGPTIGARFHTTGALAAALLVEQADWRRCGAFPVRISRYGDEFDLERQTIGLLPIWWCCAGKVSGRPLAGSPDDEIRPHSRKLG